MTKKVIIPIVMILAAFLVGCSQNATSPQSTSTNQPSQSSQGTSPKTLQDIAQYKNQDRQTILEAGSRQEGTITWYTSHNEQSGKPIVDAFTAKYPWIKIEYYRADGTDMAQRLIQEYAAKRYDVDVLESTTDPFTVLRDSGLLQSFYSPEFSAYSQQSREKNNLWATVRESFIGLGYNTKLIKPEEVPKTYDDLLSPKWKDKMSIAGSSTGVKWLGDLVQNKGVDFVNKLAQQNIRVQNISGRALADLVVSGEVPISPTIFNSHVSVSSSKGAPIAWVPLEPVESNTGAVALPKYAKHPYSAMLFIDFLLSDEGQKLYIKEGYDSARQSLSSGKNNFQKFYPSESVDDYGKSYEQWQSLLDKSFIKK